MTSFEKCKAIVLEAGKRLLCMTADAKMTISEKTDFKNIVTSCDTATQDYLVSELGKAVPEATFLCEEEGLSDTSGKYIFIIDPIDGTTNFVMDFKHSAISVAFADHEKVLWGIVYNPFREELFEACRGIGAKLNGETIHVSSRPLIHSLAVFGTSPYYPDLETETFKILPVLQKKCMDIRRLGSAALDICYIACGRVGLFFELRLSPWDYAAAMCILLEAGGVIYDMNGCKLDYTKKNSILAGTEDTVKSFLAEVKY